MVKVNPKKYQLAGVDALPFKGVTRMESKCEGYDTVNWFYKTKNFQQILESKESHFNLFNKLTNNQNMKTDKLDLSRFTKVSELNQYAGAKLVYETHNGDINAIKRYFSSFYSDNTKGNYAFKKFSEMLPNVSNPKGRELKTLKAIKQQLKG
ncbi:MAG: hypothetical protein AAFO07_25165 [Bacteroidota bacterium]